MNIFESMRRQHADLYTANPVDTLADSDLAPIAPAHGMTVAELRQQAHQPHTSMTCPLCGRPSTHLVQCKGCGSGSWGYELEEAHGAGIIQLLRTTLHQVLDGLALTAEVVDAACRHAYSYSGCMICADCWHHTVGSNSYLICPLQMLAETKVLQPGMPPRAYWYTHLNAEPSYQAWANRVRKHWCEIWNTVEDKQPRPEGRRAWRGGILDTALTPTTLGGQSVEERVNEVLAALGVGEFQAGAE